MRHSIRTSLAGLLLAGVASCSGVINSGSTSGAGGSSNSGKGGNNTTSGNGGSNSTGNGGSASTGSGGGTVTDPTIKCSAGIPPTTQLRRLLNNQYDATVKDLLGVTTVTAPEGSGVPSSILYADADGPMVSDAWRIYQDVGAAIAKQVMASSTLKQNFITCDPAASGCLQTTIQTFGRKAFRRPLTTTEVSQFQALGTGTPTGTPAEVAEAILFAFLVDPNFLYIVESNTTAATGNGLPSGAMQLSSYEVAARLSYMIWGSTPDSTLSAAADANQLQTKAQILAQAQRMVQVKDKTAAQLAAFHEEWVQMDNSGQHWWHIDHDTSLFPKYSTADKPTYQAEMDNFFATVGQTGQYKDLFLSNVGFVTKNTAPIYGLDASKYNTTLTQVALNSDQRPGFMTRIGFLSSYSHYNETSPILRGAFTVIYMLGVNVPPPPPGAAMTQPPPGNYKTNREKVTALVMQGADCQSCHTSVINPPGFVLENFDSIGQWQTTDPLGGPIDATATVNFGYGSPQNVTSVTQLMQGIADSTNGQRTYAQYWAAFAYGRDPNPQDQCVADKIASNIAGGSYPILNILSDLTQADQFNVRVRATP
jgi:hypothetical protein